MLEATADELSEALRLDSTLVEAGMRALAVRLRAGDRDHVDAAWRTLEADLSAHLRAEEELILPGFARSFPHEAARVHREHNQLRAELARVARQIYARTAAPDVVESPRNALHAHLWHEQRLLYRWAQGQLGDDDKRVVFLRLRALLRAQVRERLQARAPDGLSASPLARAPAPGTQPA